MENRKKARFHALFACLYLCGKGGWEKGVFLGKKAFHGENRLIHVDMWKVFVCSQPLARMFARMSFTVSANS